MSSLRSTIETLPQVTFFPFAATGSESVGEAGDDANKPSPTWIPDMAVQWGGGSSLTVLTLPGNPAEADVEIAEGRVWRFDSMDDLIADLKNPD